MCEAIDAVHERTPSATSRILLEKTAGQGTCVGHRFEHLQAIFEGAKTSERLGVCLDTQHAFAAGYDLSTEEGYEKAWSAFEACVGLGRLRAFHLNDSKKPLGARVDRHEHLGEGVIGLRAFWRLANDPRFAVIPAVLETEPREGGEPFKVEVALLEGLVGGAAPTAKAVFALEVVEAKTAKKERGKGGGRDGLGGQGRTSAARGGGSRPRVGEGSRSGSGSGSGSGSRSGVGSGSARRALRIRGVGRRGDEPWRRHRPTRGQPQPKSARFSASRPTLARSFA